MPIINIGISSNAGEGSVSSSPIPPSFYFNPGILSFFHLFGNTTFPTNKTLEIIGMDLAPEETYTLHKNIEYVSGNNWLSIVDEVVSSGIDTTFTLAVNPTGMPPALYTAKIKFWLTDSNNNQVTEYTYFYVYFTISDNDYLSVLPTSLSFSHQLGGNIPAPQSLQISSNMDWDAESNNAVVELSQSNGNGDATLMVSLGVGVDALAVGSHNYTVTINGTVIPVYITIVAAGGFSVSPQVLNFEYFIGASAPAQQLINIFVDGPWQINTNTYCVLSAYTGNNSSVVQVGINTSGLEVGNYATILQITSGSETLEVEINIEVQNFLVNPFQISQLFYTKNLNFLEFNSPNENTYIQLTMDIKVWNWDDEFKTYQKIFKLPLYKRTGSFHPGNVVHQLLVDLEYLFQSLPDFSGNEIFPQYYPAEVNIAIQEKDITTGDTLISTSIEGLKFAKGYNERHELMCESSKELCRITQGTILTLPFNIVAFPEPMETAFVEINEEAIEEVPYPIIYSHVLLSLFYRDNFTEIGDILNISFYHEFKKWITFPKGNESVFVFFKNQYGIIEVFECTGDYQFGSDFKNDTNTSVSLNYAKERNNEVLTKQNLKIDTGWLADGDVVTLQQMRKSNKIFISFDFRRMLDGEDIIPTMIEARPIWKRLVNKDTENVLISYDLEFEIIENTDDKVY